MARRYSKKSSEGLGMAILLIFGAIAAGVKAVFDFISNNIEVFSVIALAVAIIVIVALIYNAVVKKHRRVLLNDILVFLHLHFFMVCLRC